MFKETLLGFTRNEMKLYEAIFLKGGQSEREIEFMIYGRNANTLSKKYLILKSRFKEKILNKLSLVDFGEKHVIHRSSKLIELYNDLYLAKLLESRDLKIIGTEQVRRNLISGIQYSLSEIQLISIRSLIRYSALSSDEKHLNELILQQKAVYNKYRVELFAENMYWVMISKVQKSKILDESLIRYVNINYIKIRDMVCRNRSRKSEYYLYRIGFIYYQLTQNYSQILNICSRFEKLLGSEKSFEKESILVEISLFRIKALNLLSKIKTGLLIASKNENIFLKGSFNWYSYNEQYLLLAMKSKNWILSWTIYFEAVKHDRFKTHSTYIQHTWLLMGTYLQFMDNRAGFSSFNSDNFLMLESVFDSDKVGFIVSQKIIQILYLSVDNQVELLDYKMESLRVFVLRNINKSKSERTFYFVKILRKLIDSIIKDKKIVKISSEIEILRNSKLNSPSNYYNMEIIPYELLLNHLVGLFKFSIV